MSGKQKETHGEIVPGHGRRGKGRGGGRERNDAGEGELHGCVWQVRWCRVQHNKDRNKINEQGGELKLEDGREETTHAGKTFGDPYPESSHYQRVPSSEL